MLYVIAGATASGKSAVAVALAQKINGEIINADSMQVYKGMDIGTAKPTLDERGSVPHHLLDIVRPDEPFSVALFKELAKEKISQILARGSVPILVGGTGFYINAVVYDTDFSQGGETDDTTLRAQYTALAAEKGANHVHEMLTRRDPQAAQGIHPQNIKRVARALAFCESTGTLFSLHNAIQREKKTTSLPADTHFFVLDMPREQLYARINARTNVMLSAGLEQEAANLLAAGYAAHLPAMQSIGYKEVLQNAQPLHEHIAQSTRRYAKRQLTWFRNSAPHAIWIDASGGCADEIAKKILTKGR
ncbi:MAG: tRNA (adenosine(37)-N6)-dimethylallyltransferase MiaA [Defluviitaleaceae bacterium]|nr:tRNA (adenosine(37)-N6)-dimethylallyltransferase MiaA [Defluviitaleaceae bacterium]MCL2275485.1 tRNA (adenosine(37)-N6)-dimethylallyltransferase MiaA [Defluviitaleaceae bacterium]